MEDIIFTTKKFFWIVYMLSFEFSVTRWNLEDICDLDIVQGLVRLRKSVTKSEIKVSRDRFYLNVEKEENIDEWLFLLIADRFSSHLK